MATVIKTIVCKLFPNCFLIVRWHFFDVGKEEFVSVTTCRKNFNEDEPWIKKTNDSAFDVTIGSYDGAEVCELVGLYILPILQEKLGNPNIGNPNIGLYRDDGLGAMHNLNARTSDRKRKDITETFKNLGLKITIEANLKTVNFLNVTLDLGNESYKPYRKPNDNPLYINASSNHPPSILKQLPKNISKRVSGISSSKEIFDQAAPYYNDALKASGYREKIEFQPPETAAKQESQKRKRKVIWFSPRTA